MDGVDFHIRDAEPDDAEAISELIQELAKYEKLAHESHPDPDALRQHLDRSSTPYCEAILAMEDATDKPVGFALFYPSYSTFLTNFGLYVEDLFVEPAFRKAGIGQALLARVVEIALERGCQRVEWSVLDWNELAIGFYRQLGATSLEEWTTMRLSGDALRQ